MKNIVVLNGIHASGKSTLGQRFVESHCGHRFFPEIGAQVRTEMQHDTLSKGGTFDSEVIRRETVRDEKLLVSDNIPVVETWHTGNLAYVGIRVPDLYDSHKDKILQQLSLFRPTCILVTVPWLLFRERASQLTPQDKLAGLQSFYETYLHWQMHVYHDLHIPYTEIDNSGSLSASLARIESLLC